MAIEVEIWVQDIQKNLFPQNSFMLQSKNDTPFVVDGKRVWLPQSGTEPTVVVNRTTLPATSTQRTDTATSYDLDSFTSDPTTIRDIEEVETSYDKRMSVIEDHTGKLNASISDTLLVKWAPAAAANIVRTTGTDRIAMSPGATGNRKKITVKDFLNAKRIMDKNDIPQEDRYCIMPAEMYNDLLEDPDIIEFSKAGNALNDGTVNRIYGFGIYIRSRVLTFTNATTPVVKLPGAATAISDNAAALFWHKNFVRRALGEITLFVDEKNPLYYGTVMSAEVRAGGRNARTDEKGVVVLVEAHS